MTAAHLIHLVAMLFAALCAPARMLARVAGLDAARLRRLVRLLQRMQARGVALAYEGEDDAVIAARIDRAAWIAADPVGALRHMVRGTRGLMRALFAMVAPLGDAPPALAGLPLREAVAGAACADTS